MHENQFNICVLWIPWTEKCKKYKSAGKPSNATFKCTVEGSSIVLDVNI